MGPRSVGAKNGICLIKIWIEPQSTQSAQSMKNQAATLCDLCDLCGNQPKDFANCDDTRCDSAMIVQDGLIPDAVGNRLESAT
jgi:hypothetical protein